MILQQVEVKNTAEDVLGLTAAEEQEVGDDVRFVYKMNHFRIPHIWIPLDPGQRRRCSFKTVPNR